MSAAQGAKGKLYLARASREASGMIGASGDISLPCLSPCGVIKRAQPPVARFCLALGARGTLSQGGEPRGPPTMVLAPIDVMNVTVHSQQEHGNHTLTRYDSGHSTMMTSIPPQR
jgi:hypothetical protein